MKFQVQVKVQMQKKVNWREKVKKQVQVLVQMKGQVEVQGQLQVLVFRMTSTSIKHFSSYTLLFSEIPQMVFCHIPF